MPDVPRVYFSQTSITISVRVAKATLRFEALFVIVIVVFFIFPIALVLLLILTVGLVVEADGCLDWEVSQQRLAITVEVVIGLGFRPEQSVVEKTKNLNKYLQHCSLGFTISPLTCLLITGLQANT